jgi:hypothetical protein
MQNGANSVLISLGVEADWFEELKRLVPTK